MIFFSRALASAMVLGFAGVANATSFTFDDAPASSTLVSELDATSFSSSVDYAGLDGAISSAVLTVFLSDDSSSTFGPTYVDTPIENVRLSSVTGSLGAVSPGLVAEVDGNSGVAAGITADVSGAQEFPVGSGAPTPAPGTIGSYFNIDVTALLGGTSGTLSFILDVLDTRTSFPDVTLPGGQVVPGGIYLEDFNYEGAQLSIVTAVPVPAAAWLLASGLIGLLGFSRKRVV